MDPKNLSARPGRTGGLVFWAGVAALAAAAIAAGYFVFGGDGGGPALSETPVIVTGSSATVAVASLEFNPRNLHVPAGAVVTWQFTDNIPHNVRARDGRFQSETMTDGAFSYKFEEPGEYAYVCTIHPRMTGVVVVGADDGKTPAAGATSTP